MSTSRKLERAKPFSNENEEVNGPVQNKVLKQFGKSALNRSFAGNETHSKQVSSIEKEDQFSIGDDASIGETSKCSSFD